MDPGSADAVGVRGVRALAHPLRLKMLDLLRFEGPSTATMLASQLGESSGATSYHLRQLAKYGFIQEEPHQGGRERWWRYLERRAAIDLDGDESTGRTLIAELLSRETQALDAFLAQYGRNGAWDDAAFFCSRALRLTPSELNKLQRGIDRLLRPLRRADAQQPPKDARPVRLLAFGYPASEGLA